MHKKITKFFLFMILSITGLYSVDIVPVKKGSAPVSIDYKHKTDDFWKGHLSPEVYHICRQKGTELAGSGKYDHFYEKGTYYCACCGGDYPLYSSEAKYDSHTGWPSFWEPISATNVTEKEDRGGLTGWAFPRTEIVCSRCGGHLGHVFKDGPKEHGGLRYCMNSLALTFVPEGEQPRNLLKTSKTEENLKP